MTDAFAPERVAAVARALGPELLLRVTLYADALAQSLTHELGLVAWDCEQLTGGLQQRLRQLARERPALAREAEGVRVLERRSQPLESIDLAWRELRQGRRVRIDHERGACSAALELMRGMARLVADRAGARILDVADALALPSAWQPPASGTWRDPASFRLVGPHEPGPRVAVIAADADRELSAYVLARASLRRTGADPRAVKRAYVVGPTDRLQRHLVRLFVGATMGPASSPSSFAGPASPALAHEFSRAHEAWSAHPDVETWCQGGVLERGDDPDRYLAPALFATTSPAPELPLEGPMLVVVRCRADEARVRAEVAAREGGRLIVVGTMRPPFPGDVTHIKGALLVERLPPGLPEPRPV